jgi:peptidoglycan/LPS O-acetylase OafA/YrhL
VLLVVVYHCGIPFVAGGYVGVDVFLVISGFLITSLLLREIRTHGTISIPGFYARRALRLLPAAGVVVVATVAAATAWLPPLRRGEILLDSLYATVSALNYRLAAVGTDYLGAAGEPSPLQHFWSLAVEEQFYLVWPPLLLLAAVGRRRGRLRTRRVCAALIAVTAGSFALSVTQTAQNASWAYFGAHTRAWELAVGALIAVAAGRFTGLTRRAAMLLNGCGLAAIVASAGLFSAATPFPGHAALLPVAGTAAVIIGGCAAPSAGLSAPALQGVGRLSYSWYLWHWPFLVIAPAALGVAGSWWQNVVFAVGAFGAAALTYALVENPARRLTALREHPWRGVVAGGALAATSAGLCLLITAVAAFTADATSYRAPSVTGDGFDARRHLSGVVAASVHAPAVPANLKPKLAKAADDRPRPNRDGCDPSFTDAEVKTPCAYGDLASPTTVVLFGDSHAGHWFPALERIAEQRHWRLVVVTKSACTAADAEVFHEKLRREYTECTTWRAAAWRHIEALRPARIFLASVTVGDMLDARGGQDRAWADAWARSVQRVSRGGAKVYYLGDTPWQQDIVPECLSAHLDEPRACARSRAAALVQPQRRGLVMRALRGRGVTVIDPVPWFCTDAVCPVIVGNVLVYKDAHHMTTVYSRLLAPLLSAAVGD